MIKFFKRTKKNQYAVSCILFRQLDGEAPIYHHTIHNIEAVNEDVAKEIAGDMALENYHNYTIIDKVSIKL